VTLLKQCKDTDLSIQKKKCIFATQISEDKQVLINALKKGDFRYYEAKFQALS
jgi:hypothetical protein